MFELSGSGLASQPQCSSQLLLASQGLLQTGHFCQQPLKDTHTDTNTPASQTHYLMWLDTKISCAA